jgi:hypothetical protein
MNIIKDSLKVIIISSAISLSAIFVLAQTGFWVEPTTSPPGENRPAPLTLDAQGNLTVPGNLTAQGNVLFKNDLRVDNLISSKFIKYDANPYFDVILPAETNWVEIAGWGHNQNDPDSYWSTVTERWHQLKGDIAAIKLEGDFNDAGFCYAYAVKGDKSKEATGDFETIISSGFTDDCQISWGIPWRCFENRCNPNNKPDCSINFLMFRSLPGYKSVISASNGYINYAFPVFGHAGSARTGEIRKELPVGTWLRVYGAHLIGKHTDWNVCHLYVKYKRPAS